MSDPEAVQALVHPLRTQILEALREPASAAAVARQLSQPRQRVNYHLKTLAQARLVEHVGERRVGNFVESLFKSVARTFLIAPAVAWADPRRAEALRSQHSLATLVVLGERLQRDAIGLLDRAAFDGEEIASASVTVEVKFASEQERSAFLEEYMWALRPLLDRHGAKEGAPYRVVLAAYPDDERRAQ